MWGEGRGGGGGGREGRRKFSRRITLKKKGIRHNEKQSYVRRNPDVIISKRVHFSHLFYYFYTINCAEHLLNIVVFPISF